MPKSATILLIRHAEKSGNANDAGLTAAGQARAQAYVAYFPSLTRDMDVPAPSILIAAADSPNSIRSRLTLTPLSQSLGVPIEADIADHDYPRLADRLLAEARYDHATTLLCWHHGQLLALAQALGVDEQALPKLWPDAVFGWLLRLEYGAAGRLANIDVRNQQLMFGDGIGQAGGQLPH